MLRTAAQGRIEPPRHAQRHFLHHILSRLEPADSREDKRLHAPLGLAPKPRHLLSSFAVVVLRHRWYAVGSGETLTGRFYRSRGFPTFRDLSPLPRAEISRHFPNLPRPRLQAA